MLVNFEYVGQGEPPDLEFVGLVDGRDWKASETLDEAIDRKNRFKSKYQKKGLNDVEPYWHEKSKLAWLEAERLIKKLQN